VHRTTVGEVCNDRGTEGVLVMRVGPYPVLGERLDGVAPGRRVRSRFVSETSSLPAGSALSELAALLLSTERFEDLVQGVSTRTPG
jgi:hypothetical protein